MTKAKLIVVEGIDGSGKTTLVRKLSERNQTTHTVAFPNAMTAPGKLIRDVFDGRESVRPETMKWLFIAEAQEWEHRIKTLLDAGLDVICDRHVMFSGPVYQSRTRDEFDQLVDQTTSKLFAVTKPDFVFIVDVAAELALARRGSRGEAQNTLYEPSDVDKITQQRLKYLAFSDHPTWRARVRVLDGHASTAVNSSTVEAWVSHPTPYQLDLLSSR